MHCRLERRSKINKTNILHCICRSGRQSQACRFSAGVLIKRLQPRCSLASLKPCQRRRQSPQVLDSAAAGPHVQGVAADRSHDRLSHPFPKSLLCLHSHFVVGESLERDHPSVGLLRSVQMGLASHQRRSSSERQGSDGWRYLADLPLVLHQKFPSCVSVARGALLTSNVTG